MDLLLAAGYDSSSSLSHLSEHNDTLREGNSQNAFHGDAPHNSPGLGCADDSSKSTAAGNVAKKRVSYQSSLQSPSVTKKQKSAQFITIASYDNSCHLSEQSFERSNPHWEGRWAGHIYLPFPNIKTLDVCDNDEPAHEESNDESDANIIAYEDSGSNSGESSVEDEGLQESRDFIPTAKKLIHYWAAVLNETYDNDDCNGSGSVIVPHVSMRSQNTTKHISTETTKTKDTQTNNNDLHISLSRPIYLPAPSVASFLTDISSSLASVQSAAGRHGQSNSYTGRTIHLRPHNATIFINDNQTRSFLSIPISEESSRWIKRVLLPSIDATMIRFGQKAYYDEGIMHVSIASIKGNVIPIMLNNKPKGDLIQSSSDDESKISSIPLFHTEDCDGFAGDASTIIPESIPIRLDRIHCDFGKVKNLVLPF